MSCFVRSVGQLQAFHGFYEPAPVLVIGHVGSLLPLSSLNSNSFSDEKGFSMRGRIIGWIGTTRFFPASVFMPPFMFWLQGQYLLSLRSLIPVGASRC